MLPWESKCYPSSDREIFDSFNPTQSVKLFQIFFLGAAAVDSGHRPIFQYLSSMSVNLIVHIRRDNSAGVLQIFAPKPCKVGRAGITVFLRCLFRFPVKIALKRVRNSVGCIHGHSLKLLWKLGILSHSRFFLVSASVHHFPNVCSQRGHYHTSDLPEDLPKKVLRSSWQWNWRKSFQRWVNICHHRIKYDSEFGQISIVTLKQTVARKLSDFMLRKAFFLRHPERFSWQVDWDAKSGKTNESFFPLAEEKLLI